MSYMPPIPQAQPLFSDSTTLNVDTPCAICGYNLRGLTVDKVCPECGSAIGRSIHGNMLRYADPKWLGSVLLAVFLITTQEPKIAMKEDTITLRRAVRVCAVAAFIGNCLEPFSGILPENLLMSIMVRVTGLLALVAYFGTFVYLRRFALRIPNKKLALSTKRCMWGFIIATGAAVVFGLLAAFLGGATGTTPGVGFAAGIGIVVCAAVAALLVFAIWYLILLFDYRNAFRSAMEQSREFPG